MARTVLLPAAGASSRMRGGDKLLEDVGGAPCLRVMAARALESAPRVIVTLPEASHPRAEALEGLPVETVIVPDASDGMAASLRAGAAVVSEKSALMVLPPDMPAVEADDIGALWRSFEAAPPGTILRACAEDGTAGHPVIFASRYLPEFAALHGDTGAAAILRRFPTALRLHLLPGTRATLDLDTPEDWARWRHASRPAE